MNIWLVSAGIAILQTLLGNIIVFYNSPYLLLLHVFVAIILLALAIYGYFRVKLQMEKRILAGNIGLIVITGALGYLYTINASPIISIIHLLLAIGIVSNFSVLYGFERGQKYK
ncbi:conserved hypothetical protein [Sulfolobus islandicus Y.G.57.14]|uniref:Uncharacterized protein n=4 Tax=Saccharolobus TaxID=2100760 RepID=Q97UX5_SACS2|nr:MULTISPECIES: hypothetical protein [Sulfolobaceae]PVU76700.1 hypothetical protein DDW12_09465 [Sulfolobus islandicus]AAK42973.1 Hypothetical protein SSO2866 [Saccharolobus solfataricus P2]ACP46823.1 conserved hypothetical protein [Sulfolobus islandicus Y.G.57.14]AKA73048.1 hypothetical protein SULB_0663 [Saccharolobus solfataricus]AKA75746.1 hypothetical protein SULC_0661 [Saccharolobus solfataricus]